MMIIQKTFSKKIIAMLFVALLSLGNIQKISATVFADENLRYEIVYHWGIIWKHAATASLSIRSVGTKYAGDINAITQGLGAWFLPLAIGVLFIPLIYFSTKTFRSK